MKSTKTYHGLPVYPEGWYVVSFSDELENGQIKNITFCGEQLVLFRTEKGEVGLIDAYCGHMGAHLGHGGKIVGETIKCPFHGFCFDKEGECTETGYGTPPSPRVGINHFPVNEIHGVIMSYYHPLGEAPSWDVPDIDTSEWTDMKHITWKLKSHPQETAENAVDIGHFSEVHFYREIEEIQPFTYDGPLVKARYAGVRPAGIKAFNKDINFEFEITKYGFGYSCVEAYTSDYDLYTRHFVFSQPIDGEYINLRIAVSLKHIKNPGKVNPVMSLIPKKIAEKIVLNATFENYKLDVSQDFKIWENKKYVHPPALSKGDGPVMQFRKWAEQFYPQEIEELVRV